MISANVSRVLRAKAERNCISWYVIVGGRKCVQVATVLFIYEFIIRSM